MAAVNGIRLCLAVVWFSYLIICINGVISVTARANLQENKHRIPHVTETGFLGSFGEKIRREEDDHDKVITDRRLMEVVKLSDYPGWGANHRHMPRAQVGRGCIDC